MSSGLDYDTLRLTLETIRDFSKERLTEQSILDLDAADEAPEELIREMCGDGLGIQLLFIPEEYGGMGGGTFDVYRVCEAMAYIDLGIATGVLATFLGSDPISVGGTPEQQKEWLSRLANEGLLMAYGATEPEAGSDLAALKTTATPVMEDGAVAGYRISGRKQWISNGGIADVCSILANAPGGPTWFVIDAGTPGFTHGKPEDKQGLRTSNTAALFLEDVFVGVDRRVGESEGQGLLVAQTVFGYSRLMVAALGLGAGWAALDRAIPYSTTRIQAGGPLSGKQGYTHKLIVPHAVHLEAARAYIEESAERIDAGEGALNTEGAVSKFMATEAGHAAADASIQALGGYGYTRDYMVEKITRDVRITRIFEGTSEIMEMTIARDRWQQHLKSRGRFFLDEADKMEALHASNPNVGADVAALGFAALAGVMERARIERLTRSQHILFRLGELIAYSECAGSLSRRAARAAEGHLPPKADTRFEATALAAMARIFARESALKAGRDGLRWIVGTPLNTNKDIGQIEQSLGLRSIDAAQEGLVADMDFVADVLYERDAI
jgi:alkylation response protein AidB-like acyl-CoA dehydrogenase